MADRRLVLVAMVALVSFAAFGGACGDSHQPRGDEIKAMIDDVWAATGVDRDEVDVTGYFQELLRDTTLCEGLERDDRWYASRGSSLPPDLVDQRTILNAIVEFLEREGFEVGVYRDARPAAGTRLYWAVRGEMVVDGLVEENGGTTVHVQSGPCAPLIGSYEGDDDYVRVDE